MKKITLFIILFFLVTLNVQAVQITLDKDTILHPQGWGSSALLFKKGTVVLNERGEVVSGIAKGIFYSRPAGEVYYHLQVQYESVGRFIKCDQIRYDPGLVLFNERGEVTSGVLADTEWVSLYNDQSDYVRFIGELTFSSDHSVSKGTLYRDQSLRPLGWNHQTWSSSTQGFIIFKGEKQVVLSKGEAVSGTLAQDTELMTTYGKKKLFLEGTLVTFNENGEAL